MAAFRRVSVLLLITCTNVAGLLLTRAAHRHQEFSVRLALGGSPVAVAAQTLIEAVLVSVLGGSIGLLIAVWATTLLQSAGAGLPRIDEITIDWRILLYTLGTALFVGVLCGIFPAIRAARHRMNPALGENERTTVSGRNPLPVSYTHLTLPTN